MGFFINASKNKKRQKAIFLVTAILVAGGLIGSSLIGVFSGGGGQEASPLPVTAGQTIADLEEELAENPEDVGLLSRLAEAYYNNHQADQSLEMYKQALQIDPANSSVRTSLATVYFLESEYDQAIAEIKTELEHSPDNKKAHFYLGQFLAYGKKNYTGGIEELETFLEMAAGDELFTAELKKAEQIIEELKDLGG